ncbi:hypothetical protein LguiA_005804 [Lonicera macranthoides]
MDSLDKRGKTLGSTPDVILRGVHLGKPGNYEGGGRRRAVAGRKERSGRRQGGGKDVSCSGDREGERYDELQRIERGRGRRRELCVRMKCSRFTRVNQYIDESDTDECALAACVLRSAFTKASRSVHSGYHCDMHHIGKHLMLFEKDCVDVGGFFSTEKMVYPFFPEFVPEFEMIKPPTYAASVNTNLFSMYITHILPSLTTKYFVQPSSMVTYSYDILLLQCLSTAIFAGIDIAKKAYYSNTALFDRAVFANDREHIFELISSHYCEKSLKQRLKRLGKKLIKAVRGVKVERLPRHYLLTNFYMGFVPKKQKLLGVEHIMNKF